MLTAEMKSHARAKLLIAEGWKGGNRARYCRGTFPGCFACGARRLLGTIAPLNLFRLFVKIKRVRVISYTLLSKALRQSAVVVGG